MKVHNNFEAYEDDNFCILDLLYQPKKYFFQFDVKFQGGTIVKKSPLQSK